MAGQVRDARFDFRMGTVGQGLRVRPDTKAFISGFRDSNNMHVRADGEAVRRWGTWERQVLTQETRLETWDFAEGEDTQFLLFFSNGTLQIKDADLDEKALFTGMPWGAEEVWFLTVTWEREKMVITDESFRTKIVTYNSLAGTFSQQDFSFDTVDGEDDSPLAAPFHEFEEDVYYTLTNFITRENRGYGEYIAEAFGISESDFDLEDGTGEIEITDGNFDLTGRGGQHLRVGGGEIRLDSIDSPTRAQYTVVRDICVKLGVDPVWTRNHSKVVEIAWFSHNLKPGDEVFLYGIPDDDDDDAEETESHIRYAPKIELDGDSVGPPRNGEGRKYTVHKVNDQDHFEIVGDGVSTKQFGLMGRSDIRVIATDSWGRLKGIAEPVYSPQAGWPTAGCLHESRLWLGGSGKLPDAVFASQFGQYRNFDMGEGDPTDAVQLLSIGQQARVRHMVSEFDLIILTDKGEFYVPGSADRAISQETARVVSATEHGASFTTPRVMDGGMFFVDRVGRNIREMKIESRDEAYSAPPTSLVIPDWLDEPKHSCFWRGSVYKNTPLMIWSNLPDGSAITMHANRNEDFFGFMRWTMNEASFVSFASLSSRLFACCKRKTGTYFLVEFDTLAKDYVTTDFSFYADVPDDTLVWDMAGTDGRDQSQIEAIATGESTWKVYSSNIFNWVNGILTFPDEVTEIRMGDPMAVKATFGPPNIATRGGTELGSIASIVMAEIHWVETQTGYVHGEDIVTPLEEELFGPRGVVDGFKQYWPGIWDREPVLELIANEPGHFGLRMLNMRAKF